MGTDLGDFPGGQGISVAYDVNRYSVVVGFGTDGTGCCGYQAFRWEPGKGLLNLGALPGSYDDNRAYGINDLGQIVGSSNNKAFIWTAALGMRDLNSLVTNLPAGWTLQLARDVNEAGQIVGTAITADGQTKRAFVLTPVPEPSLFALVAAVGAFSVALSRRGPGAP